MTSGGELVRQPTRTRAELAELATPAVLKIAEAYKHHLHAASAATGEQFIHDEGSPDFLTAGLAVHAAVFIATCAALGLTLAEGIVFADVAAGKLHAASLN